MRQFCTATSLYNLPCLTCPDRYNVSCAVFKLVEGQDVQQTEAAIEEYRKANYAEIVANDAKKVFVTCMEAKMYQCLRVTQCACCVLIVQLHCCLQRGRVQPRITGPAVNPADPQASGQSQPSAAAYTADQRSCTRCALAYADIPQFTVTTDAMFAMYAHLP